MAKVGTPKKTLGERVGQLERRVDVIEKLEERRGQSMHSLIGDIAKLHARIDSIPETVTQKVVEQLRPQLVEEMRLLRTELWEKMEKFAEQLSCKAK